MKLNLDKQLTEKYNKKRPEWKFTIPLFFFSLFFHNKVQLDLSDLRPSLAVHLHTKNASKRIFAIWWSL